MRAVIQRVKSASVTVDDKVISSIGKGLLVLIGVTTTDTEAECEKVAKKILGLRLWPKIEDNTPWRSNVNEIGGEILCVSQFTLYGNVKKGTKPDFHQAAGGEHAKGLYDKVLEKISKECKVQDGQFGAMMDVALVNDGPVTIQYDTAS